MAVSVVVLARCRYHSSQRISEEPGHNERIGKLPDFGNYNDLHLSAGVAGPPRLGENTDKISPRGAGKPGGTTSDADDFSRRQASLMHSPRTEALVRCSV